MCGMPVAMLETLFLLASHYSGPLVGNCCASNGFVMYPERQAVAGALWTRNLAVSELGRLRGSPAPKNSEEGFTEVDHHNLKPLLDQEVNVENPNSV